MNEGGKIRTANILKRMKGGAFEVTLASPVPKGFEQHRGDINSVCDSFLSWPAPRTTRLRRIRALLDPAPVAAAMDRSRAGSAVIAQALAAKPDVVLVDFPHAAVLLPDRIEPASVIFTHNVEAEIFERHAAIARRLMRPVWRSQSLKMRRFEGEALRRFDSVIAVSKRDGKALTELYQLPTVEVIDTGVDLEFYAMSPRPALAPADSGTIVFTGAMDWRANIDGIEYLMDEVWPLVLAKRPRVNAVIVGRNPPPDLVAKAKDRGLAWEFTGFVNDIRAYVRHSHVYVIPLRVGSGTRIKAFEAMAMGRPVVSTTIGVEGLDVTPETHYLAADTAADFAAGILRLLGDPNLCVRLARAARGRVEERFSWSHVARQFEDICMRALERHTG
jgi:glycosyltransferase involved in cell wall biosynthesis